MYIKCKECGATIYLHLHFKSWFPVRSGDFEIACHPRLDQRWTEFEKINFTITLIVPLVNNICFVSICRHLTICLSHFKYTIWKCGGRGGCLNSFAITFWSILPNILLILCVGIVSIQIHQNSNFHFSNPASEEMKVALVTFRGGDKGQQALTHCLLLK